MERNQLLQDKTQENKDPQGIVISTCHPKLNTLLSILKNNFHLISNNSKISNIFKQKRIVIYRKNKLFPD